MTTQPTVNGEPTTNAGAKMALLVREAWLATSQLAEQAAEETRESAFRLVLEALLRTGEAENGGGVSALSSDTAASKDDSTIDGLYTTKDLQVDGIASYLEVDRESVELLYSMDSDEPDLQTSKINFAKQLKPATRQIALLVLGARTALGLDTQMDDIRKVAERYEKYDAPNFARTLQSSEFFVVLGKPRSSRRTVRLRPKGVEAARELAARLVAE